MPELEPKAGLLDHPDVQKLIHTHLTHAVAQTPEESAHGLDLSELRASEVRFWSLWLGDDLHAIGAWKQIGDNQAELKSMHVAEAVRRRGTGAVLLQHLIQDAEAANIGTLFLQTGSGPFFAPAVALYRRHGFIECPPFADYGEDQNSIYMIRESGAKTR